MSTMQPSAGELHVNGPLTNLSVAYFQDDTKYVSNRVFPMVPVQKQSDTYFIYDKSDLLDNDITPVPDGAETPGGTVALSQGTFQCEVYGRHKDITDRQRANQDQPLNLDADMTRVVTQKGLILKESVWASTFLRSGAWDAAVDGATARSSSFDPTNSSNNNVVYWSTAASDPIGDIYRAIDYVESQTSFTPNKLTIGKEAYRALENHSDVVGRLDRGQTTGAAMATPEALARLFGLDEVLVLSAVSTSEANGYIGGGKHALLTYSPSAAGIGMPSAGYSFMWTGLVAGGGGGIAISRYRMQSMRKDRIELIMAFDHRVVSKDLGYFFNNIVQ